VTVLGLAATHVHFDPHHCLKVVLSKDRNGGSDDAKYPNWSPTPWPPDHLEILKWRWEKKILRFWTERTKFGSSRFQHS
jgi:hypothetical protein